jgi:hypothetical protein
METFALRRALLCRECVTLVECAVSRNLDPRPAQSSLVETCTLRRVLLCGDPHRAQSAISFNVCWGRTYVTTTGMSALCHNRTLRPYIR